jgi:predicted oxidoreductase
VSELLILVAFLERLAARPIPQLSMGDKDRLHEAAQALRIEAARQSRSSRRQALDSSRRALRKCDRAELDEAIE